MIPVKLTDKELEDFQNKLTAIDNYGFLHSDYEDVRDVDLDNVYYIGAGMSNPDNSEGLPMRI